MKQMLTVFIVMSLITLMPPAHAGYRSHTVTGRQVNQQQRINQGVRSGELTPSEAHHLELEEARLHHQEQRFQSTGNGLNGREYAKLQREENHLNHRIDHQKHDAQGH